MLLCYVLCGAVPFVGFTLEGNAMTTKKYSFSGFLSSVRPGVPMLLGVWVSGMAFGIVLCQFLKEAVTSLMGSVLTGRISIVALLLTILIPLTVSLLCQRYRFFLLVYLTAFAEALVLGFSAYAVVLYSGHAGWLIHIFLLFHCYIGAACSLWLWLRQFSGRDTTFSRDLWIYAIVTGAAGAADYFLVSPFWGTLWH